MHPLHHIKVDFSWHRLMHEAVHDAEQVLLASQNDALSFPYHLNATPHDSHLLYSDLIHMVSFLQLIIATEHQLCLDKCRLTNNVFGFLCIFPCHLRDCKGWTKLQFLMSREWERAAQMQALPSYNGDVWRICAKVTEQQCGHINFLLVHLSSHSVMMITPFL